MTTQELRELDAWIAEHVMGWVPGSMSGLWKIGPSSFRNFHPTLLAADAMDVLKKCAEKHAVWVGRLEGNWALSLTDSRELTHMTYGDTLEIAIAKFARAIFTKQ